MKNVLVVLLCTLFLSCTRPDQAERVLQQSGYTNVVMTGYCAFCCGEDDTFATGFEATSPSGQRVKGVVCSGWMKGATIRLR